MYTGFHGIDLDTGAVQDLFLPNPSRGSIKPHSIITLPRSDGGELLLCFDSECTYSVYRSMVVFMSEACLVHNAHRSVGGGGGPRAIHIGIDLSPIQHGTLWQQFCTSCVYCELMLFQY